MKKMYFENASLELIRFSADVITSSGELNPEELPVTTVDGDRWSLSDNEKSIFG